MDTDTGDNGQRFSEGQKQRISIARAILADTPVLLLDEATSALDVATERKVLHNIIRHDHTPHGGGDSPPAQCLCPVHPGLPGGGRAI